MESVNSSKWLDAMKEELKSMDHNGFSPISLKLVRYTNPSPRINVSLHPLIIVDHLSHGRFTNPTHTNDGNYRNSMIIPSLEAWSDKRN